MTWLEPSLNRLETLKVPLKTVAISSIPSYVTAHLPSGLYGYKLVICAHNERILETNCVM
jgi:hypothetical protein